MEAMPEVWPPALRKRGQIDAARVHTHRGMAHGGRPILAPEDGCTEGWRVKGREADQDDARIRTRTAFDPPPRTSDFGRAAPVRNQRHAPFLPILPVSGPRYPVNLPSAAMAHTFFANTITIMLVEAVANAGVAGR